MKRFKLLLSFFTLISCNPHQNQYDIEELYRQQSELKNQITDLEYKNSELEEQISDLESNNSDLEGQISDLESRISYLK
jgi:septal ring factor EnvC (AmiA/AmiB activator)